VIGVDSNLLLRAVLADDTGQAERARRLLAARCSPQRPGFVNRVVLCEAVWTLTTGYRFSRQQLAATLEQLLAAPALLFEDRPAVEAALPLFRSSRADFADWLIGVLNRRAGCETTYTFDRRAAATAEFSPVP
jgi:predicted nucleic-acid-binding protein